MNLRLYLRNPPYEWALPLITFLIVALLTRVPVYGNPAIHIDEQFYLLVGDRMLEGYLPYVDIWDRKPIGLFLIYGFVRWVGGAGIVEYQVAATFAATATALAIYYTARGIAPRAAAMSAGAAYLVYLLVFNGIGGQSPVFYNALTALAAFWTMRLVSATRTNFFVARSAAVMLLLGVAIQIKYTVIFEGMFFGLALLSKHWFSRRSLLSIIAVAILWIFIALLPTFGAIAYYIYIGHAADFLQANFFSIFGRNEVPKETVVRLVETIALLTPLLAGAVISLKSLQRDPEPNAQVVAFLKYWLIAAFAGYLIFGTYYDHYAIPLLLPLCILASHSLAKSGPVGWSLRIAVFGVGIIAALALTISNIKREGSGQQVAVLTRLIEQNLAGGCMHVYEGVPILYLTSNACFSTRFIFPSHLSSRKEALALGVSPVQEMKELLARKPQVVILRDKPKKGSPNLETRRELQATLDVDYKVVGRGDLGKYKMLVYSRQSYR